MSCLCGRTLWGLGLSEGFFFLLCQYLLPEKVSFSQVFKFLYKLLVLPKYWISFLHAYIFTRLLFAAMKYLPSGFFSPTTCSIHICLAQLSHVTTTKTTAEQGGGRGAKSALICLLFAETVHYWHCRLWQLHSREIWSQCNTSVPLLTHLS